MRAFPTIVAASAFILSAAAGAQDPGTAPTIQRWEGEVVGPPITVESPLAPVPTKPGSARRLVLPTPKGAIPKEAIIPLAEGGGTVTLLAPWRGGWLVGTDAGEWGGALYLALPGQRITLARGPVLGGFTWRDRLYVLSGLQHLALDRGEVWEVDLGASRLVRRIPLPAMPTEVIVTGEGMIVRTGRGDVAL